MTPNHYEGADETKVAVGKALRAARESMGWSREKAAHELDTTASALYRQETGRTSPTLSSLHAASSAYNTTVSSFFSISTSEATAQAKNLIEGETNDNQQ